MLLYLFLFSCFNNDDGLVSILKYGIFKIRAIKAAVPAMMKTAVTKVIGMFIVVTIAISGGMKGALLGGIIRA